MSKPTLGTPAPARISPKPIGSARGRAKILAKPNHASLAPDTRGLIAIVRLWEESQRYRIRVGNMVGAIERDGAAVPIELGAYLDLLTQGEKGLAKRIAKEWRGHPLAPWAASVKGIGEHSIAVIVALLDGNPYIAYPKHWEGSHASGEAHSPIAPSQENGAGQNWREAQCDTAGPKRFLVADEPRARTVSQLWQYCGHGRPGKRRAGMSQEEAFALGKPLLKARIHLAAENLIKARNEQYRAIYDGARAHVAERIHPDKCAQCKAKPGDPWKPGHQHAHALRIVGKELLREMWLEAKRIHELAPL